MWKIPGRSIKETADKRACRQAAKSKKKGKRVSCICTYTIWCVPTQTHKWTRGLKLLASRAAEQLVSERSCEYSPSEKKSETPREVYPFKVSAGWCGDYTLYVLVQGYTFIRLLGCDRFRCLRARDFNFNSPGISEMWCNLGFRFSLSCYFIGQFYLSVIILVLWV